MLLLFRVGFVTLLLELAVIRWVAAYVPFLSFFTNVVLMAAFLGMSAGCLLPERSGWLKWTAGCWLVLVGAVLGLHRLYRSWSELNVDLLGRDVVFYGGESRLDLARFHVPIEAVTVACFLLVAVTFLGLGQAMARAFEQVPDRVAAYSANVAGSLLGVGVFALLSFLETAPAVWFGLGFLGLATLLPRAVLLPSTVALGLAWVGIALGGVSHGAGWSTHWSPYYRIVHDEARGDVSVNGVGHQRMWSLQAEGIGGIYRAVHQERAEAGGPPFRRVLVIGAGTGNDVAHALDRGAEHVDAVDIDPVLLELGAEFHPERPYDDPRVVRHVADGRAFLERVQEPYDLVVYGLVDSLILSSSVGDLRLESFLFTREAMDRVQQALAPGGVFVTMNFFREPWVADRVAAAMEEAFDEWPVRLDLATGATALLVGPVEGPRPEIVGSRMARDDWPFPYLRKPSLPRLYVGTALLLLLSGWAVLRVAHGTTPPVGGRMFFLGAGFLLLETRAVVALGLGYGNTWITSSVVFAMVLVLILLANLVAARTTSTSVRGPYLGLFASLLAALLLPMGALGRGGDAVVALLPIAFAGVIFARSFRGSRNPGRDLGANIAGAMVGGLSEYLSLATGFRGLLLLAGLYYFLSWWRPRPEPDATLDRS